jgi:hypothetical protein
MVKGGSGNNATLNCQVVMVNFMVIEDGKKVGCGWWCYMFYYKICKKGG